MPHRAVPPRSLPGPAYLPEPTPDTPSDLPASASPSVLLVDDRPENLLALEATLAPVAATHGVRLLHAQSADEALRHALAEGDALAVALVDVEMPGIDGPETARLIRARRKTEHVPVIFVTARDAERRRVTLAYQSGAVDYVTKPYDPDVLRAKVAAFVDLHRRRADARAHERRRFADLAARGEARLHAVLESLPDAVVVLDAAWECRYVNPAATALLRRLGVRPEAVLGRVLWEAVPALGDPYEGAARRARAEGGPVAVEAHAGPLGAWHEIRAVPSPDGLVTLYARDVTARQVAEREREELLAAAQAARADAERARAEAEAARADAVRANAAKSRFLATVSHELRTPLNAIMGHVQLIEMTIHGPITDAQRQALARVDGAQRHLLRLIDEVLDFAKLESGRLEYHVGSASLADALRDATQMIEPQGAAKGLAVTASLPAPDVDVWADRARLGQVLLNVLANAVKFTDRGGVAVHVTDDPHDPARVRVHVVDTGAGIPPDQLDRIFEPFVQGDAPARDGEARRQEGTGLGLAISRELARGMGGDLRATATPGGGATFILTLRRVVSIGGAPVDRRSRDERREGGERRGAPPRRAGDAG